jgi:hypothetical protein
VESEELNLMEGLALSKTEEKFTSSVSVRWTRNVGAAATLDSFALTVGMKNDR